MNNELAMRTFAYLISNYKENNETIINSEEIEAIEFLIKENQQLQQRIDKAIEYINKYAWQEDIIGGIYTTTGKPAIDRYMQLDWDNCNELLDILKEVE